MPPDTPYTICWPPDTPTPSTGIYWSRVILLQVSMICHQPVHQAAVLSDIQHPLMPLNAPRERHLVAKSGTDLGSVHMSSCAIVYNRPS